MHPGGRPRARHGSAGLAGRGRGLGAARHRGTRPPGGEQADPRFRGAAARRRRRPLADSRGGRGPAPPADRPRLALHRACPACLSRGTRDETAGHVGFLHPDGPRRLSCRPHRAEGGGHATAQRQAGVVASVAGLSGGLLGP
ncbi:hypothetical protein SBRY_50842 [Actinacidiphila bryophytorum]|uniref:Uncharacterized protein n=1 Tax=Actinacidiphila bryophytorum TaxID=1436133 RepID=A0A9W4H5N7_9ACTN|nr:hypothetical protein SBRY_50842 [Actinacidiphila bryophytorum]